MFPQVINTQQRNTAKKLGFTTSNNCVLRHYPRLSVHVYNISPRAKGFLFVLKGPYDQRIPPIVKFSQESESARLAKIILSKNTVKTL